jgi:predicted GNAT family acetyltransferase
MSATASEEPIQVVDSQRRHRYEARRGDEVVGFLTYERARERITFLHTETNQSARGQGIAGQLAAAALDDARSKRLEVIPRCPFVAGFINEHPEYQDLVAASGR